MKEDNGRQDVGATAFDLPNSQNPHQKFHPFYGSSSSKNLSNTSAKITHHEEVIRQVNEAL